MQTQGLKHDLKLLARLCYLRVGISFHLCCFEKFFIIKFTICTFKVSLIVK